MIASVRDDARAVDVGWRARLRRKLVSYAAAVAINMELVVGPPRTSYRSTKQLVTWNLAEPLVDGTWSRRELISENSPRVVVCDLSVEENARAFPLKGFNPN